MLYFLQNSFRLALCNFERTKDRHNETIEQLFDVHFSPIFRTKNLYTYRNIS